MEKSLKDDSRFRSHEIYKKYRRGVYFKDILEEYDITEDDLIAILNRNIKGNYNYKEIFKGGHMAQKKHIADLNSRPPAYIRPEMPYPEHEQEPEVRLLSRREVRGHRWKRRDGQTLGHAQEHGVRGADAR